MFININVNTIDTEAAILFKIRNNYLSSGKITSNRLSVKRLNAFFWCLFWQLTGLYPRVCNLKDSKFCSIKKVFFFQKYQQIFKLQGCRFYPQCRNYPYSPYNYLVSSVFLSSNIKLYMLVSFWTLSYVILDYILL